MNIKKIIREEVDEFDWIDDVPNYVNFENLEFKPHQLAQGLPDIEELDVYRGNNGILDKFRNMVHATMTFGDDVWISVVGGGPTYSDLENELWEVWSSELQDPVPMERHEIDDHMRLLQGKS